MRKSTVLSPCFAILTSNTPNNSLITLRQFVFSSSYLSQSSPLGPISSPCLHLYIPMSPMNNSVPSSLISRRNLTGHPSVTIDSGLSRADSSSSRIESALLFTVVIHSSACSNANDSVDGTNVPELHTRQIG